MPGTQLSREFLPLCHEHHVTMRAKQIPVGGTTQMPTYACPESDCLVNYNISVGYFMLNRNANAGELDIVPKVNCPRDRAPMYLAEIHPETKSFRLWVCPQCDARRTNEGGLVGNVEPSARHGKSDSRRKLSARSAQRRFA
jgi:hypothetical protein